MRSEALDVRRGSRGPAQTSIFVLIGTSPTCNQPLDANGTGIPSHPDRPQRL